MAWRRSFPPSAKQSRAALDMQAPGLHAHAIPTRYGGVQFRSRLEARWAAMFDLLGWRWAYEPLELPGWIPDFAIYDPIGGVGVLCEVKPATMLLEFEERDDYLRLIEQRNDDAELLLLGLTPFPSDAGAFAGHWSWTSALGWLGERVLSGGWSFADAVLIEHPNRSVGLISPVGDLRCRVHGPVASDPAGLDVWTCDRLWRAAGNRTQWVAEACPS